VANRRHCKTMKVEICRESIHRTAAARCERQSRGMDVRGDSDPGLREILQVVTQSEDQPVTGIHAQRGSFAAIAVGIAVTDFAMIKEVAVSNGHFKLAVLTA
jgi:hypothetical protein